MSIEERDSENKESDNMDLTPNFQETPNKSAKLFHVEKKLHRQINTMLKKQVNEWMVNYLIEHQNKTKLNLETQYISHQETNRIILIL